MMSKRRSLDSEGSRCFSEEWFLFYFYFYFLIFKIFVLRALTVCPPVYINDSPNLAGSALTELGTRFGQQELVFFLGHCSKFAKALEALRPR